IGSAAHDAIVRTSEGNVARTTQRAGGIEAGMSTGEPIRVRVAMKPIATVPRALQTVDVSTGQSTEEYAQWFDVTAVAASGVVAEAMVALTVAEEVLEKFGGDSVEETQRNMQAFIATIPTIPEPDTDAAHEDDMGDPL